MTKLSTIIIIVTVILIGINLGTYLIGETEWFQATQATLSHLFVFAIGLIIGRAHGRNK